MTDTSGMLPNWLSEAIDDRHDPKDIAQAILRSGEWIDIIEEAVQEAEGIMQAQQSTVGIAGGYPSYNQEVARAITTRLADLYPEVYLPKP
jgi:hypothetical protein